MQINKKEYHDFWGLFYQMEIVFSTHSYMFFGTTYTTHGIKKQKMATTLILLCSNHYKEKTSLS